MSATSFTCLPAITGDRTANRAYDFDMPVKALGAGPDPGAPRLVTVRAFADTKSVVAILSADCPVFVVLRAPESERTRILDLLAGWALGSGGNLDKISPNTVLARPAGSGVIRLARHGVLSAVDEAFTGDGPTPLSREEERRLRPLAAAGQEAARRRLVDAYTELATLLAVRLRPSTLSEASAVAAAHEELDWLVGRPGPGSLLAELMERLLLRLCH